MALERPREDMLTRIWRNGGSHDKDGDGFITYDEIIKTTYSYKAGMNV